MEDNFIIEYGQDIWDRDSGIILIPVNCVGVMGAGLAKACKEKYPHIYLDYRAECLAGKYKIGTLRIYVLDKDFAIMLIPTKLDWRNPSKYEWLDKTLEKLGTCLPRSSIKTIHVPPLGCGCGGLDIMDVEQMVQKHLCQDDITIHFYKPN